MEDNYPCLCGHSFGMHYDPDNMSKDAPFGGQCQAEKTRPAGSHHCSSCALDPSEYCMCYEFRPDNLKYLEDHSANEH